jgi:hypothetical protein
MDSAAFLAALSAAVAIVVAALTAGSTYLLTKKREQEADWRKMKLDLYRNYIAALSGIVEGRETPEGHVRYVDAVNSLMLVASSQVLRALYAYMDHTTSRDVDKTRERHDELLTILVNALRKDIYPADRQDNDPLLFRLITIPPHMRPSLEVAHQD